MLRLPREIVDQIVSEFSKDDLKSLRLVHRMFNVPCREIIFRSITFSTSQLAELYAKGHRWMELEKSSFLMDVRSLHIKRHEEDLLPPALSSVLDKLINVEEINFSRGSTEANGLQYTLPVTLKKLSIRGPISIPLKSYPENLQDLTVQCAFTHKLQFPPKLERLCMIFTGVLRLKHFPQSLRYIDISAIKTCRPCTLPELPSSLHTLKLACGALDNLLTLPESLRVLEIQNFKTKLPKLPQNLNTFSLAYYRNMEFFPQNYLPNSLRILKLSHTEIAKLPELPPALEVLFCEQNPITELPKLPKTLQSLCFSQCNIECIPPNYLPDGLRSLDLSCNQITKLPGLPPKLEILKVHGNQNLELPKLPESIRSLDFCGSKIKYIPPNYFPDGLRHLDVSWNEIEKLPDLPPKLKVLVVKGNRNLELPKLPKTLKIVEICNHKWDR